MTTEKQTDTIEQALAELRQAANPAGPSQQLLHQTLVRLQKLDPPVKLVTATHSFWRSGSRGFIAAAACVLFVAATFWSGLFGHGASIAFADVQQQLQKLRTVRYVSTRLVDEVADAPEELKELERKGEKPDPKRVYRMGSNAHQPRVIRVLGRYLQRIEILDDMGAVAMVNIDDFKLGKHVTLDPRAKECTELTTQVTMSVDGKVTSEAKIQPSPEADLFAQISEIPPDATTRLPERIIGGKKAIGFFSQKTQKTQRGTQTWERTYWVDPETKLPIRVDTSHYGADKRIGHSDWISSGFVFDEPMPAEQFSTKVPEGYTLKTSKILGIKID